MNRSSLRFNSLFRLALTGGRADHLRITLTAVGSALGTLIYFAMLSVLLIKPSNGPYKLEIIDQSGLRVGVLIALGLLSIPVLVFVGLCARVGAPGRDRRLAMIRMAGATASQTTRIAATETAIAAFLGSLLGTVAFYTIRLFYPARTGANTTEQLYLLPTDVDLAPWFAVLLAMLLPTLATISAVAALKKVIISPFGVTRLQPTRPPAVIPAVLFLAGTIGLIAWDRTGAFLYDRTDKDTIVLSVGLCLFLITSIGLILGSASLTSLIGRTVAPRTGRPSLLLASRRMIVAPFTSSRAATAVVLATFIGGATSFVRASFLASATDPQDPFYTNTFDLVNWVLIFAIVVASASLLVTSSEAIVSRRRTFASLSAAGTPRRTLAISALAETLLPLLPAVALAAFSGMFAARGVYGSTVPADVTVNTDTDATLQEVAEIAVPIPWGSVAALTFTTFIACTTITALSLLFLKQSTNLTELRTT